MRILTKFKNAFIDFMKGDSPRKFLENLSEEQKNLSSRIFDLVIGRVLKRAYLSLDEKEKRSMERVFLSDNDEEKEKFTKKYIPNFAEFLKEESQKITEEIKTEIEKQV